MSDDSISSEVAEKQMTETQLRTELREKDKLLHEYTTMVEAVCEMEGVADMLALMRKLGKEREDFVRERQGYQKMMKEFNEMSTAMQLAPNERMIDKWRSMKDENMKLSAQLEAVKVQSTRQNGTVLKAAKKMDDLNSENASPKERFQQMRRKEEKVMGKSKGMLANTLPKLSKYSGKKEDWTYFEKGFLIRYGEMEREVSMSLLHDCLEGDAKEALRSVPEEEKENGVENVLKWLKKKLSNETPFEEVDLEMKLRNQEIKDRTVGEVCEEMEEWTRKLCVDETEIESKRRRQLLIVYQGREVEYARLLTLFGEGAPYSKLKATLVEIEYSRKMEMEITGYGGYDNSHVTCWYCGGYGHKAFECPSRLEDGYEYGENCGDYGCDYEGRQEEQDDNGNWQGGQSGGDYGYGNGDEYGVHQAHMEAAPRNGGARYGGCTRKW